MTLNIDNDLLATFKDRFFVIKKDFSNEDEPQSSLEIAFDQEEDEIDWNKCLFTLDRYV